ncbi:MAG: hypothetical protein JSV51_07815 [Candidatus Bathyarchaeota archaeon]|nr:MAG: hypothetical protein JSV51_07815 [Candidatus Bathyarchaeota archaeon]
MLTNKRMIYEGSKPGPFSSTPDVLSFSLKNFTDAEIVSAGMLDKYLEVRFDTKTSRETVHIVGRKLEKIKEALQEYKTA